MTSPAPSRRLADTGSRHRNVGRRGALRCGGHRRATRSRTARLEFPDPLGLIKVVDVVSHQIHALLRRRGASPLPYRPRGPARRSRVTLGGSSLVSQNLSKRSPRWVVPVLRAMTTRTPVRRGSHRWQSSRRRGSSRSHLRLRRQSSFASLAPLRAWAETARLHELRSLMQHQDGEGPSEISVKCP